MSVATNAAVLARGHVRFSIAVMMFGITMVNYADRATIAIAGPGLRPERSAARPHQRHGHSQHKPGMLSGVRWTTIREVEAGGCCDLPGIIAAVAP